MSERDYAPLSLACVRGLCDKIYDKRKFSGVEIEKMVKDFSDANNTNQIKRLLRVLGQDLMSSTNPNVKNGALMGLSSVAVGLGKGCTTYLSDLILPIIACFSESESRVRYQAAEALFNVLKIARGDSLAHFAVVFDALARLAADPEPQVKQAAELLDRLVKDIVTETGACNISGLVPLIRERVYGRGGCARQFAISWVCVLDAVPDMSLLASLPDLLDGLVRMLDDANPEIRRMCDVQLNEFLRRIKKDPSAVNFQAMINILITHAQSTEEHIQLTSITWIKEFVELSGACMLPYVSGVLSAVLPCLAYSDDPRRNIRETAATVNLLLTRLVESPTLPVTSTLPETPSPSPEPHPSDPYPELDLPAVVDVLTQMLHHSSVHTKVAALDWILHLYNKLPEQMSSHSGAVFTCVVARVRDAHDDVVRRALAVLAELCDQPRQETRDLESSPYYYKFLEALLGLLAADDNLLEDRGAFIIRQLCVLLQPEEVYLALSKVLLQQRDLRFTCTMVDVLSAMLLTSAELFQLRRQLRHFDTASTRRLFLALHGCWAHSAVALLALCLLTHNYTYCTMLIQTFGDLEITVDFLTEVDKLVQLIESPIFAYMRLELLGPQSAALRSALSGLLMLLPQSEAFHLLRARLQCTPPVLTPAIEEKKPAEDPEIDFAKLLEEFKAVQAAHREYKLIDRSRGKMIDKPYS